MCHAERAEYAEHHADEPPEPARWSSGRRLADRCARGVDGCIHEAWIATFERMVGPGRDHEARIRSRLEPSPRQEFVEPAR